MLTMRKIGSVRVWLLLVLIGQAGWSQQHTQLPTAEQIKILRDYIEKSNVDFIIKGRVVDQESKPLQKVQVFIRGVKQTTGTATEEKNDKVIVNDSFEFSVRDSRSVCLTFLADGYYPNVIEFGSAQPGTDAILPGKTHTYENVIVVLRKMGQLAVLNGYDPLLSYGYDGSCTSWDIAGITTEKVETRCVKGVGRPAPDVPCVYMQVIPSKAPIEPVMVGPEEAFPANRIVQLVLQDGKGGGFVRAYSKAKNAVEAGRDFTTAPTEGYSPVLTLSPEDIAGFRHAKNVYFYCKINGLLGKGYIGSFVYVPNKKVSECYLQFYIQSVKDATNVVTRSW